MYKCVFYCINKINLVRILFVFCRKNQIHKKCPSDNSSMKILEVGAKEFVRFVSIVHVILHKKHFVIVDNFMNFTYAYLIDEKLDDFLSKIISQFNPYP